MQELDVFVQLIPHGDLKYRHETSRALELSHNSRWFRKATSSTAPEQPVIASREPTPALPPESEIGKEAVEEDRFEEDRLVITFSELLDGFEDGIHLGTNPRSCHILLGHRGTRAISAQHCTIFVDSNLRLWLRDQSTFGTAVECDGDNRYEVRQNHDWILTNTPGEVPLFHQITIHIGRRALCVEFPNHEALGTGYLENLRKLVKKYETTTEQSKDESSAIEKLDLQSNTTTAAPSGSLTPQNRPIYYDKEVLGKGAFGEVRKVIQAHTARYFAAKSFFRPNNKRHRDAEDPKWRVRIQREFDIMAKYPHPNVVQVFEFRDGPEPRIIMAYYPTGSLAEASFMNKTLYISAFGQILHGLNHLHQNGIVHRDLKPANFLVESRPLFKVAIADFGLANIMPDDTLLKTFCGTLTYIAPEVFPGSSNGHAQSADIWSLGVIVLQWIYGSPKTLAYDPARYQQWIQNWGGRLLAKLDQEEDCALTELLSCMLEPTPSKRWSAKQCLDYGLSNDRLFRLRAADGLVVCVDDLADVPEPDSTEDYAATPTVGSDGSSHIPSSTPRNVQHSSDSPSIKTSDHKEPRPDSPVEKTPTAVHVEVGDELRSAVLAASSSERGSTWSSVSTGLGVTYPSSSIWGTS